MVIEAFGCELPDSYLAAMTRRVVAPVWINLEYVTRRHGSRTATACRRCGRDAQSINTSSFPGFTSRTGRLLREHDLAVKRDTFDAAAEAEFWRSIGRTAAAGKSGNCAS